MLFNSIDFAIFLPIVFLLYWFVFNKNTKIQNFFLLIASYFFYAWWDWRFLFLIVFITCVDFFTTHMMVKYESINKKRLFLIISITANLGLLFFFKYYNFFMESFAGAFSLFGTKVDFVTINIILPLGISFYIFQSLSYVFDVYLEKIEPTKSIVVYAAFLSFFPKLVMGPIEKPSNILPQFYRERKFNYDKAVDGFRQILWGLFKKIVIADNCAVIVNNIFGNYQNFNGSTLLLGAVLFAFQIYCDFSGYSDMAIGVARLFNFDLMQNFAYPYFSRNIAEFWRRWHISLTKWLTDYIFLPTQMKFRNLRRYSNIIAVTMTFLVCGLWHGANWTFIIWGLLNGFYLSVFILFTKGQSSLGGNLNNHFLPSTKEFSKILGTFAITVFAWIFFRVESLSQAVSFLGKIFSVSLFHIPEIKPFVLLYLIIFLVIIEWLGREHLYAIENIGYISPRVFRWAVYTGIIFLIIMFAPTKETPFIYLQF